MSYSHASILAFLYAGAVDEEDKLRRKVKPIPALFEGWEGRRGFVYYAEPLAQSIADYLNEVDDEDSEVFHPGVAEYEVIEPLGGWLLTNPTESDKAFDKFKADYKAWLTKE